MLSTATLMERREPYDLPIELARGTLNRLRNEVATLQSAGLILPEAVHGRDEEALQNLVKAATVQDAPDEAAGFAQKSIAAALAGLDVVSGAVAEQDHASAAASDEPHHSSVGMPLAQRSAAPRLPGHLCIGLQHRNGAVFMGTNRIERRSQKLDVGRCPRAMVPETRPAHLRRATFGVEAPQPAGLVVSLGG